jgi:hypothetical protein
MSFLLTLSDDRLAEIIPLLEKYEKKIEEAEPLFNLNGQKLEFVCKTLPHHLSSYDQSYQELKSLEEWLNSKRDKVQARLWKKYTEGYARALSAKDIQAYIAGEPEFVTFTEIILEVSHLKGKFQSIGEGFTTMNWMVGHITKLRIAELQDVTL